MSGLRSLLTLFFVFTVFLTPLSQASASERLTVRVGAYNNPPKIRIGEKGKVTGFWPELISNIAEKENWDITYIKGSWPEGLTNLRNDKIDIMPDVAFTRRRAELYDFAKSTVLAGWSRVYVRNSDNSIQSLEDLTGKRVAGLSGSVNIEGPDGIKKIVESFNLKCTVVELQSYQDVFKALEDGYADAVITNRNFGDAYAKDHPVKSTPIMLSPVSVTFAFPKGAELTPHLRERIDYQMSVMMNDNNSVYYKLLSKYFAPEIAQKTVRELPSWYREFIIGTITAAALLMFLMLLFRRQVRQKTKELRELNSELKEMIEQETAKRIRNEQIIFEQKKFADMGQMISAISHQWRQPLNNIYLISQYLQDEMEKGAVYNHEHLDAFGKMDTLIHHMSGTIDDFRNFFMPEKEMTVFSVSDTVLSCLRILTPEMVYNNVKLSFRCKCSEKECFVNEKISDHNCGKNALLMNGFEGEFKQIILNVIGNSYDAVMEKKSGRGIEVRLSEGSGFITITITDNGGGVPEDVLPRVFDPYFTTKAEGKGTGMGLYICKAILQSHMNSTISMRNVKDGAETKITVPAVRN